MKYLRVVIVSLMLCILSCTVCSFAADIDSNSIEGVETDPNIVVDSSYSSGKISFKITNNSDSDMRNVYLVSRDSKLVLDEYITSLGKIGSGDSREFDIGVFSVKSSQLANITKHLGGYRWFENILVVVLIAVILLIICFLSRKSESKELITFISIIAVLFCSLVSYYSYKQNRVTGYELGEIGKNYTRLCDVSCGEEIASFDLKYNQDDIVYKTVESTEYVDFDIDYEYDSNIACSDKPKIKEKGVNGTKKVISTVKYKNGQKVDSSVEFEEVLSEPKNQVEVQGTKTTIDLVNIEANREYVEDDSMKVGDYKLITDLLTAKSNIGKKEIKYVWDKDKKEVVKSEKVTKQPGTNRWKAGSLVVREEITEADTRYIAVNDKPVGWKNVIKQGKDGIKTTIYKTKISAETGKPVNEDDLTYYTTLKTEPVNGRVEVGVLKEEKVVFERDIRYKKDKSKWDNFENITTEGQDRIEVVKSIMDMDPKTGVILDTAKKEVSREVVQKEIKKVIVIGTKKPEWIEEKIATDQVKYNTIYKPDKRLSGDEKVVEISGENGRLITTQLVAVDEKGNKIESYKPKIIEENALQKPVDEVIRVAPDSELLKK